MWSTHAQATRDALFSYPRFSSMTFWNLFAIFNNFLMPFLNLQKKNFEVWHIPFRKIIEYVKKIIWNLNDSSPPHIKTHGWSRSFRKSMEVIFLMICPTPNWHLTNSWRFQKQKWYVNFGQSAINIAMIWNPQCRNGYFLICIENCTKTLYDYNVSGTASSDGNKFSCSSIERISI